VWVAALGIALASNVDNLTVGIALGMRPVAVSWGANLVIAAVTMLGTAIAVGSGSALTTSLPASWANKLGGVALIVIGAWMVMSAASAWRRRLTAPVTTRYGRLAALRDPLSLIATRPQGGALTLREAILLGIGLALNNVASGVPAGAAGISVGLVSGLAGVASLVCVGGGARIGSGVSLRIAGPYAPGLAGAMIIAVGAYAAAPL
jgi:putative sporulation protein YtaF